MRTLVFTDLDGTLLAHDSYSWDGARPALLELRRRGIPLVFCTSKTRTEVRPLRRAIGNTDPFIVENGGVVVIPTSHSSRQKPATRKRDRILLLGSPYAKVITALKNIARQSGIDVRGFHQMTDQEVAERTGLSLKEAHRARQRETGEPFLFLNARPRETRAFTRAAYAMGYSVQRGGRFWHISGNCDKGLAVSAVISFYRAAWGTSIHTIALGDSGNDLPMLQVVDQPIVMPQPDGRFAKDVTTALPRALCFPEKDPGGWGHAVLRALAARKNNLSSPKTKRSPKTESGKTLRYGT
jgi:mannosyl-3-phosphoglycerate phosphatase